MPVSSRKDIPYDFRFISASPPSAAPPVVPSGEKFGSSLSTSMRRAAAPKEGRLT
jgi:hypothetical protein